MMIEKKRDHGGGLDAAVKAFGGPRDEWVDLSTGINPVPYPIPDFCTDTWTALPDERAFGELEAAARRFWNVPEGASIVAAQGASAIIAALPALMQARQVYIPEPTYNEHRAAFLAHGWAPGDENAYARVLVHPNNPTGHWYRAEDLKGKFVIIDESFADVAPDRSFVLEAANAGRLVLKSFGKFWGLAGLRLGFAIGPEELIEPLRARLGPWAVSGPALELGAKALRDTAWAEATRARLSRDAARLDALMLQHGTLVGGAPLFRLYDVGDAKAFQERLARGKIWSRIFPYSKAWVRLGLPDGAGFARLEAML